MNDVEIRLCHPTESEWEPLAKVDGSYEDFARMDTRSVVNRTTTAFEPHIGDFPEYRLVLVDGNRRVLSKHWVPIDPERGDWCHGLESHVNELVLKWRGLG